MSFWNRVIAAFLFLSSTIALCVAAAVPVVLTATVVPTVVTPPVPNPPDFLTQVIYTVYNMGGLPTMMKISSLILLIIASMKVSVLNDLVWSKLGEGQVWVAPLLGLIAGIFGLGAGGVPVTAPMILAYVLSGAGAIFLHELLDSLKAAPGVGLAYQWLISIFERFLGGGSKTVGVK